MHVMRLTTLTLALGAAMSASATTTIDNFSTDQPALTLTFPPAGTSASSSASGAGILGGQRDTAINLTAGVIAGNQMSAVTSSGFFSYSQDATIAGLTTLQWDGTDGSATFNPTGLGGVDLTAGGSQDGIGITLIFDDLPATVTFTVASDAGNVSTASLALPGLIFSNTTFVLPFSSFTPSMGSGANFANVGAIQMTMGSAVTAPDVVIDQLVAQSLLDVTQSAALSVDNHDAGIANPGDVIHYTVTVNNADDPANGDETGVQVVGGIDPNTTLVAGSVTTSVGTVTTGNVSGDTAVAVNVGTVADGSSVTIGYDVTVKNPLPAGTAVISAQSTVSSASLSNLLSDDPSASGEADPTTLPASTTPVTLQQFSVD